MDIVNVVQGVTVFAANAVLPGSGVAVNAAFELGKICFEIAEALAGVRDSASSFKIRRAAIESNEKALRRILGILERIQNKDALTIGLQEAILEFRAEVCKYTQDVKRIARFHLALQAFYRADIETAGKDAKQSGFLLIQLVTAECSIDGSRHHGVQDPIRSSPGATALAVTAVDLASESTELTDDIDDYLRHPDLMKEMMRPEIQTELLAVLQKERTYHATKHRWEVDPVVLAIEDKLKSLSTRSVQNEAKNLPDWFVTEGMLTYDVTTIGFGGDAEIFKGVLDDAPVAVKFPKPQSKDRFVATASLWERIWPRSPYICKLKGANHLASSPYFVMELCDGGPLDLVLRKRASGTEKQALELLAQAAHGVAAMHSLDIVHGDLKCDNILVTSGSSCEARLADFDRSFDFREVTAGQRPEKIKACDKGVEITEAVRFLAPECVQGMLPSPESDVYSFGMTMFQGLTGKSPYLDIRDDDVVRAWKRAGDLPKRDKTKIADDVWELIERCCRMAPDERPRMSEVVTSLKDLASRRCEDAVEKKSKAVEAAVDAAMGVGAAGVVVSIENSAHGQDPQAKLGLTPVKAMAKGRRAFPSRKIMFAVGLVVAAVATAGGLAAYFTASGSSESISVGSGTDANGPTPAPTPTPTSTAATPAPTTTVTPGTGSSGAESEAPPPEPTPTVAPTTAAPNPPESPSPEPEASAPPTTTTPTSEPPATTTPAPEPTTTEPPATTTPAPEPTTTEPPATTTPAATTTAPPATTTPAPLVAQVSTIMGSGSAYSTVFTGLVGVVVTSDNYIYLTDESRIFRMQDGGSASLYSGSLMADYVDGARTSARYDAPRAMARSSSDDLYICDYGNTAVRKLAGGSTVSTLYTFATSDMRGIAVDTSGNVFVTDGSTRKLTKITSSGTTSTVWTAATTLLGAAADSSGNLYVTDTYAVRKVTSTGTVALVAGSTFTTGFANGIGSAALFNAPKALAIGSDGDLYVADSGNHCIRKIVLSTQEVTTHAGVCSSIGSTDGAGTSAQFQIPRGIAAAANSVFYVTDGPDGSERLRKIYLG